MIRLHFAPADLRRITVNSHSHVMWELMCSVHGLHVGESKPSMHGRPGASIRNSPSSPLLVDLVSDYYIPDFLTPTNVSDFEAGLDAIIDAPTDHLTTQIRRLSEVKRATGWTRELASGTKTARRRLAAALRAYYAGGIAQYLETAATAVEADRAIRARLLTEHGIDGLLATLHPYLRWEPPVLTIDCNETGGANTDVSLDGRGLILLPTFYAVLPWCLKLSDAAVAIAYPARRAAYGRAVGERLATLLGPTRAAVLCTLTVAATTTHLAHRIGISLASASQHTAVLRNAGLVHTSRIGGAVLHTLTPLGKRLVDQTSRPDTFVRK